jgi:hypothetical protein
MPWSSGGCDCGGKYTSDQKMKKGPTGINVNTQPRPLGTVSFGAVRVL